MKKQETLELIDLIKDFKNGNLSYDKEPFDSNHWFRKNFRLYIEGSYSYPNNEPGYKFAQRLKNRVNEVWNLNPESKYKKLRSICIEMFMNMLKIEYEGLSSTTIQKTMVKNFSSKELELLNHHLVDDLEEYYKDQMDIN